MLDSSRFSSALAAALFLGALGGYLRARPAAVALTAMLLTAILLWRLRFELLASRAGLFGPAARSRVLQISALATVYFVFVLVEGAAAASTYLIGSWLTGLASG